MPDAGDGRMADHEQQAPSLRHGSWLGPGIQLWGAGQCPFRLIVGAALSHRAAEGHVDIDPMNPPLVVNAIVRAGIRPGLVLTDKELFARSVDFTAWLLQLECSWNAVRAHVPVTHMQPFFAAVGH
jgi:hypothetical protein